MAVDYKMFEQVFISYSIPRRIHRSSIQGTGQRMVAATENQPYKEETVPSFYDRFLGCDRALL
jgi:hypothetical protein